MARIDLEAYEVLDERFYAVQGDIGVEILHTGCRWAEGPVYVPAGRYLLWSDIPNDRVLRWDETTGGVGIFAEPAAYANGHTLDAQGRVLSCEHGGRRVTRIEHDGSVTVIADSYRGRRLNSPNDVVVASDGAVWFTDSSYGIDSDYEGNRAESELGACFVFRVDPRSGECDVVVDDAIRPTGIAFSPDEIRVPEQAANVEFGGPKRNRLFVCASTSLYSIVLGVNGARRPV
jgi:gluconolactonase